MGGGGQDPSPHRPLAAGGEGGPLDDEAPTQSRGRGPGKPLSPESLAFAGDYVFVGMVKPDEGKQHVHILAAEDAAATSARSRRVTRSAGTPDGWTCPTRWTSCGGRTANTCC